MDINIKFQVHFHQVEQNILVGIMKLVWLYGIGVVLDGNSFKWQNSDEALKMMKIRGVQVHS